MLKKYKNLVELFHFDNLAGYDEIAQFVTTRKGGHSDKAYESLNIGLSSGDNPLRVIRNRELLAEAIGANTDNFIFSRQVHGNDVRVLTIEEVRKESSSRSLPRTPADAMITDLPNICICVAVADCVPILLYDPKKKIIGIVHSGWRGTVKRIAYFAVNAMRVTYKCEPGDILAGIGPSIGPEKYEVGVDVISEIEKAFGKTANKLLNKTENKKALLDLWAANRAILVEAGVPDKNIETAGLCTYSNPDLFYSYRRDGEKFGRLAAGIMLQTD